MIVDCVFYVVKISGCNVWVGIYGMGKMLKEDLGEVL